MCAYAHAPSSSQGLMRTAPYVDDPVLRKVAPTTSKQEPKPIGIKKDGTPDMRYAQNKNAYPQKVPLGTGPSKLSVPFPDAYFVQNAPGPNPAAPVAKQPPVWGSTSFAPSKPTMRNPQINNQPQHVPGFATSGYVPQDYPATVHLKKDGTPDMRYAENRRIVNGIHVNKDGTPDMRYAENRKIVNGIHVKKDGTPDMRYAENRRMVNGIHVNKDGTPDMRYAENRRIVNGIHVKKDGTPDMRYKENRERFLR